MKNEYGEELEVLFDEKIKIERIKSFSNTTDWMKDYNDEFVYLLEGEAIIEMNNEEYRLLKDSYIFITKNTIHRVKYTSNDCKWLCIFIKE